MNWKDKRVLITGATGLVGSWLSNELVTEGAHVIAYIRDQVRDTNFKLLGLYDKATVVTGDVCDYRQLDRTFQEYEVEYCFHLAAQSIVRIGNASPYHTAGGNIQGTLAICESGRLSKCLEKLVIASSDKAYGDSREMPYREDAPLRGVHAYDVSKSCSDLIARMYSVSYAVPINIIRSGNIYGGGDFNWSRLIPNSIRRIHEDKPPILSGDGSMVRDFIHVKDAVNGYLLAAEYGLCGEAYNLGTEKPSSIKSVASMICETMGYIGKPLTGADQSNQIKEQWLNWEKAKAQLGWEPTIPLEKGIPETVNWYKAYLEDRVLA